MDVKHLLNSVKFQSGPVYDIVTNCTKVKEPTEKEIQDCGRLLQQLTKNEFGKVTQKLYDNNAVLFVKVDDFYTFRNLVLVEEDKLKVVLKKMGIVLTGTGIAATLSSIAATGAGFTGEGILLNSAAAAWQCSIGSVASGSLFATLQSAGATGAIATVGVAGGVVAAAGAGIWYIANKLRGGSPNEHQN